MRRAGIRFWLLQKRLFKIYSFLVLLGLVPLLTAGAGLGARGESGIAMILLYLPDREDRLASQIAADLMEDGGVLRYALCDSIEDGRRAVEGFQADALWIFPENTRAALEEAARWGAGRENFVVRVVQREDDMRLLFARQILCARLYPAFSYEIYVDFVRNECGLTDAAEAELREAYENMLAEGSLFRMEYPDGEAAGEDDNYLLPPIRGILALWLVLCGFAGAMYYLRDEERGTFHRLPERERLLWAFGMQGVLLLDSTAVMLAALRAAGVFTTWRREIPAAALFACCVLTFCHLCLMACRVSERLGSLLLLLMPVMLILCPVFVNVKGFEPLRSLLPPYYYLKSIHAPFHLQRMVWYVIISGLACVLLHCLQGRRIRLAAAPRAAGRRR